MIAIAIYIYIYTYQYMLYKQHSLTGVWFLCIFAYLTNHICSYSHWNESDRQCMVEIGRQPWCNTCVSTYSI